MITFLFAILLSVKAVALPISQQIFCIDWVTHRYPVNRPLVISVLRYESGRRGSEAGLNPVKTFSYDSMAQDPQAYADPTMPSDAIQHSRLARRIIYQSQEFVLEDADLRNQFFTWICKQQSYDAKVFRKTYFEEQKKAKRGWEGGGYNPWRSGSPGSLDLEQCLFRWVVCRYHLNEALFSTMLRMATSKSGAASTFNLQAQPDPSGMTELMPEGALIQSRIAWRLCADTQDWIFQDGWRRITFLRWWSRKYLAGGRIARTDAEKDLANKGYAKEFITVYKEEMEKAR